MQLLKHGDIVNWNYWSRYKKLILLTKYNHTSTNACRWLQAISQFKIACTYPHTNNELPLTSTVLNVLEGLHRHVGLCNRPHQHKVKLSVCTCMWCASVSMRPGIYNLAYTNEHCFQSSAHPCSKIGKFANNDIKLQKSTHARSWGLCILITHVDIYRHYNCIIKR